MLSYADRRFYVTNYAIAHAALRVCALWLLMFALVLGDAWLRLPRVTPVWLLLTCGWVAVPLVMLDEHDARSMQGFAVRSSQNAFSGFDPTEEHIVSLAERNSPRPGSIDACRQHRAGPKQSY